MARIKRTPAGHAFYCLACKALHVLDLRYTYNYDAERPTFKVMTGRRTRSPDIHLSVGPFPAGHPNAGKSFLCHFRIERGVITYLSSSTHEMAGKEAGLPDFEEIAAMQRARQDAIRELQAKAPAAPRAD